MVSGAKRSARETHHSPLSPAKIGKMTGTVSLLSQIPEWRGHGQLSSYVYHAMTFTEIKEAEQV